MVTGSDGIMGAVTKPITDALDTTWQNAQKAVADSIGIERHVADIQRTIEESFTKNTGFMAMIQSWGNSVADFFKWVGGQVGDWASWALNGAGDFVANLAGIPAADSLGVLAAATVQTPVGTAHTLDKPGISAVVSDALKAANNGFSRAAGIWRGEDQRAEVRALDAAKIAYDGVVEKTYDALVTQIAGSELYRGTPLTDEQKAKLRTFLQTDPSVKDAVSRYVTAEAIAISGVNASGEKVGSQGVYAAVFSALKTGTTPDAVVPGAQSVSAADLLTQIAPALTVSANKEHAVQLFNSLPASLTAQIRADQKQYDAFLAKIVTGEVSPALIDKIKQMDDPTIARFTAALDESKTAEQGYKPSLDATLRNLASIALSEDGKRLTVKATDGGEASFDGITYQPSATPAVAPAAEQGVVSGGPR